MLTWSMQSTPDPLPARLGYPVHGDGSRVDERLKPNVMLRAPQRRVNVSTAAPGPIYRPQTNGKACEEPTVMLHRGAYRSDGSDLTEAWARSTLTDDSSGATSSCHRPAATKRCWSGCVDTASFKRSAWKAPARSEPPLPDTSPRLTRRWSRPTSQTSSHDAWTESPTAWVRSRSPSADSDGHPEALTT